MPKMDSIDSKILEVLQADGRTTNHDLADQVGLSDSPCLRRVRKLEENDIITRYVALVDPDTVGLSVNAFVRVRLERQDDHHLVGFERTIREYPEVMECYLMSGEADYQLRILVSSLSDFEDFLRKKLTKIVGVSNVTTSFALRPVVYRTALPVNRLGR